MSDNALVISKGSLQKNQLAGKVALITGAGGGIGFEAARALIWLGAKVVIAEINKDKGKKAELALNTEFGEQSALFVHTDVGSERSIKKLVKKVSTRFGKLDILINNATIAPLGAVHKVGINKWDGSYQANLRGPVLLISAFLPQMLERNSGVIVLVPSSGAAPYMGAYEVFKTAQVELANTLAAELEETGVVTYSIGPGIVKTETAQRAIEEIAPLYGKSVEEFYKMNEGLEITAEEAGAGFAASVALADQYRGLEIGSTQALMDADIAAQEAKDEQKLVLGDEQRSDLFNLFQLIQQTFMEQSAGWKKRPIFERQWVIRDFKKQTGTTPESFAEQFQEFGQRLTANHLSVDDIESLPVDKLSAYYQHQMDLLKGYEKNADKLKENSGIITGWISDIEKFKQLSGLILQKNK